MNYLAHFYLADPDEQLMVGNYMGDGVRGSDLSRFPESIQRGIHFHRFIDTFTDSHDEVLAAKELFYPTQRKYSGVVVDVLFDHLLAKKWNEYHAEELVDFSQKCYKIIDEHRSLLTTRSDRFYEYMVSRNILKNYQFESGIERVFQGMDSRTPFSSNMVNSIQDLKHHAEKFETHFERFFPELVKATETWRKTH